VKPDAQASRELTAVQTDFLQYIFQAINNLLTQNLGFFDAMGQNLFRSFATILIAWFGIKSALASASGRPSFQFDHFASLLLTISFGFAMVNYYSTPIPGIGTSFHSLVTNEAQFLSSQINQAELQTVVSQVADFESRMDSPSWGDIFGTAIYVIVTILLAAAQAIAIVVIAYGFIATAVCVLVGPVFIPFFIVPKMEWLFWGWFRCFIQYAFYQVIAAAVVYVIGNLMLGALHLPPAGTLSTVQLIAWFPVLFITFRRVHLCPAENPFSHQSHFQRHGWRLVRGAARSTRRRPRSGAVMDRDATFQDAKRLYLEQYGDPMVTNTYLKIALALLSIVCVALALIDLRTIRTFQNFRPLVIRIDDLGRAEAINYHNLEYKPQDAEAKYFLSEFCAKLYYRRNRYTIQDDFSKSLYFLDGKLANGILDAYRKDDIIKKFITNTAAPEIDVDVKKVALEEMQTPPFRARVDFYMVYYSPADHSELKRDLYTANFVFLFKSQVPNELIPINPLGMTITYFREDQAFK
jgi:type IV secretory pathway TrbF-like protein